MPMTNDAIFRAIEENHKKYVLAKAADIANSNEAEIRSAHALMTRLEAFYPTTESVLERDIRVPSISDKILDGIKATAVGTAVGAAGFIGAQYLQSSSGSTAGSLLDNINPISSIGSNAQAAVKTGASALAGAGLGALVGNLLYRQMQADETGVLGEELTDWQEQIKGQEVPAEIVAVWNNTATEIVKLFRFREYLLLGEEADSDNGDAEEIKKQFITQLLSDFDFTQIEINGETLNPQNKEDRQKIINSKKFLDLLDQSIELFFLDRLNTIFIHAADEMYQAAEAGIQKERDNVFYRMFHQLFDSPEKRDVYAQKIQSNLLQDVKQFITTQKNELGFLGKAFIKNPKKTAFISGLILAAIVTGITISVAAWPVTAIILTIAAVFTLSALLTYGIKKWLAQTEDLKYNRSRKDRDGLDNVIKTLNDQIIQLHEKVANRKPVTLGEVQKLSKFSKENTTFVFKTGEVARGSVASWLREYAISYRLSKRVAVDLREKLDTIINESEAQTRSIVSEINSSQGDEKNLRQLKRFISETIKYLKDPAHETEIERFELVEKIRQQVLEITAQADVVPEMLQKFYEMPVSEGGLGSSRSELSLVRNIAPHVTDLSVASKEKFDRLVEVTDQLKEKIDQYQRKNPDAIMLLGSNDYREKLGMPDGNTDSELQKMTVKEVNQRLNDSINFLFSLVQPIAGGTAKVMETKTIETDEFYLYRTLLFRQLAVIYDPDNLNYTPEVKTAIRKIINTRFGIEPEVIFDDILTQDLLTQPIEKDISCQYSDDPEIYIPELAQISDAIRLDIAYSSSKTTPRKMLEHEIEIYSETDDDNVIQLIASDTLAERNFAVENTARGLANLKGFLGDTSRFLKQIESKSYLQANGITNAYRFDVSVSVYKRMAQTLNKIDQQLTKIDLQLGERVTVAKSPAEIDIDALKILLQAYKAMYDFAQENCFPLKSSPLYAFVKAFDDSIVKKYLETMDIEQLKSSDELITALQQLNLKLNQKTIHNLTAGQMSLKDFFNDQIQQGIDKESPPGSPRETQQIDRIQSPSNAASIDQPVQITPRPKQGFFNKLQQQGLSLFSKHPKGSPTARTDDSHTVETSHIQKPTSGGG